ncbi:MAG TPA: DUF2058 family protein [Steroidobacteraceae bacterium]|jgi:uncharacterized protein YaiL (DUF2058 family)|nr:DUF2058 family protein [Steroidobacteraceae bacterium]
MSMSLREQLLAAGLGKKKAEQDERRAKEQAERRAKEQAERTAREQQRVAQVQAAEAAKAARAQALQQRRQEEADRKERWTQIKQLIEQHRLPKLETDEYFNFVSRGKVRRLSVDASLRERIVSGELAIVRCEGKHDVVPRDIGERIRGYDARAVVSLQESASAAPAEDDPYKDYVVPDDLKW